MEFDCLFYLDDTNMMPCSSTGKMGWFILCASWPSFCFNLYELCCFRCVLSPEVMQMEWLLLYSLDLAFPDHIRYFFYLFLMTGVKYNCILYTHIIASIQVLLLLISLLVLLIFVTVILPQVFEFIIYFVITNTLSQFHLNLVLVLVILGYTLICFVPKE